MAELKMAEFKMPAIIKLSQNEWVKIFFMQNGWIQDGRLQDGCHHQLESEWISEFLLCKMDESKMVESNMAAIITLSQNESVKFLLYNLAESKMAAIIKLSENEWLWVRLT